jgi:hypothetical protein
LGGRGGSGAVVLAVVPLVSGGRGGSGAVTLTLSGAGAGAEELPAGAGVLTAGVVTLALSGAAAGTVELPAGAVLLLAPGRCA